MARIVGKQAAKRAVVEFGNRLKTLRRERDWKQHYVAEMVGVEIVTISRWENAARAPSIERVKKLAEIYGVSLEELLGETGFVPDVDELDVADDDLRFLVSEWGNLTASERRFVRGAVELVKEFREAQAA